MKVIVLSVMSMVLLFACNKKEPVAAKKIVSKVVAKPGECGSQIILARPMKMAGSDIELPVATVICFSSDSSEITVQLPKGFSYTVDGLAERSAPVLFATYHCLCSGGGACQVMYADEMGFGCIHSNCMGGCTGQFIYKGYTVNRVLNLSDTKDEFFSKPDIQRVAQLLYESKSITESFSKETLYGVPFYIVRDEKAFLSKVSCDCEGTKACTLKVKSIQFDKAAAFKIYYCEGPCSSCELTVQ